MAEMYQKAIRVNASIDEAERVCKKICTDFKMDIKESRSWNGTFFIAAAEKTNWLSTNWPTKVEIRGNMHDDKLIINVTSSSSMWSLTQANSNARKLDGIVESIRAYLE